MAIICAVAAIFYFTISMHYKTYLGKVADGSTGVPGDSHRAFIAIGQFRYMNWLITTPSLLIKMLTVLRINFSKSWTIIALMLCGDVFMIITGLIGEQQFTANGNVLVSSHMIWGAISTLGYIVALWGLYTLWNRNKENALPEERKAFKIIALTT